jgi:hypothetical protein
MTTQAFDETSPLTRKQAKAFEKWTRFNAYGVFHFNRYADGQIGTDKIYTDVAEQFILAASKRIFGKNGFRRRPHGHRIIPSWMIIEKKTDNPHLNLLVRIPEGYDFETCRERILEAWVRSPWAATDVGAAIFERRQSSATDLIGYTNKERGRISIDRMLTV